MTTVPSLKVFIPGASSGLGAALAAHYAARGAQLGLVARRAEALAEVARGLPGHPAVYLADVADARAMQAAARDFLQRFGVPDIVIANAGVSVGTLTEHAEDLAVFGRVLQTNVVGLAATFHPFVAPMREAGRGRLVGIASVAGIRAAARACSEKICWPLWVVCSTAAVPMATPKSATKNFRRG